MVAVLAPRSTLCHRLLTTADGQDDALSQSDPRSAFFDCICDDPAFSPPLIGASCRLPCLSACLPVLRYQPKHAMY